jgi:hypothetical protein
MLVIINAALPEQIIPSPVLFSFESDPSWIRFLPSFLVRYVISLEYRSLLLSTVLYGDRDVVNAPQFLSVWKFAVDNPLSLHDYPSAALYLPNSSKTLPFTT